jgi:hypothetical protein
MTNKDIEAEIDVIRDELYEATKNMTRSERTRYFKTLAEKTCKEYDFLARVNRIPVKDYQVQPISN